MKSSSHLQLSLDIEGEAAISPAVWSANSATVGAKGTLDKKEGDLPADLEFKSAVGVGRAARAASARTAGRINASKVSDADHQRLLQERHAFVQLKYERGLTRQQQNRAAYVDWSLDRIEDAKHGMHLDLLEAKIELYESLAKDIFSLREELEKFSHGARR